MKTISLIEQLRYTKFSNVYVYFYLCWDDYFRYLQDNSNDLESFGTFIRKPKCDKEWIDQEMTEKFLQDNEFELVASGSGRTLFKFIYNDDYENTLNMLTDWIKSYDYEYIAPIDFDNDEKESIIYD